jgi:hypothetical protein
MRRDIGAVTQITRRDSSRATETRLDATGCLHVIGVVEMI